MKLLPVALNVEGKRCLVVGGGVVAHRKVASLLECGAKVTVIAPELASSFAPVVGNIEFIPRVFQTGDCRGYHLVFACTDQAEVNAIILQEAQAHGIWCNVADNPDKSGFHSAARVQRGDIHIGITTTGGSPALARHLRRRIEDCIGPEYDQLLAIMGDRRDVVKRKLDRQEDRAALWREILASDALKLLRNGQRDEAAQLVDELIDRQ